MILSRLLAAFGAISLLVSLSGMRSSLAQDATPAPVAGDFRVTGQREIEVPGRIYALSPDGRWIAGAGGDSRDELCVYPLATPETAQTCVDLAAEGIASIDYERVAWSPDGSRLAFSENGPVFLHESDLWVFEVETGAVRNLTDDGVTGGIRIGDSDQEPFAVDILPAWSPDGQEIAFVRSRWEGGETQGTQLMRIPAAGGDPEEIYRVTREEPFAVYFAMAYTPDGQRLVHTVAHPEIANPDNGVWIVDRDGSNARQLASPEDSEGGYPVLVEVSPLGDHAIVVNAIALTRFTLDESPFALLDLADGTLEPLDLLDPDAPEPSFLRLVIFSPDGTRLLYTGGLGPEEMRLYVRDIGSADEFVLQGAPRAAALTLAGGLYWLPDGQVFYPTGPYAGVVLTVEPPLTRPSIAPAATPAATPASGSTPAAVGGPVDPATVAAGTALVVNDAVAAVRSAPSVDAPVVAELAQGAAVVALGPAEEAGGYRWIPVRDPATGTIGYVRAELLSAADGA